MRSLSDFVADYCTSEHYLFLDPDLKEHADSLLSYWCQETGDELSEERFEASLKKVARLDMPLPVRKAFPELLQAFLSYVSTTGRFPEADRWAKWIPQLETDYVERFREDGSVRGETVRKKFAKVGRNDPCPCGSGQKFKKCCMGLMA